MLQAALVREHSEQQMPKVNIRSFHESINLDSDAKMGRRRGDGLPFGLPFGLPKGSKWEDGGIQVEQPKHAKDYVNLFASFLSAVKRLQAFDSTITLRELVEMKGNVKGLQRRLMLKGHRGEGEDCH